MDMLDLGVQIGWMFYPELLLYKAFLSNVSRTESQMTAWVWVEIRIDEPNNMMDIQLRHLDGICFFFFLPWKHDLDNHECCDQNCLICLSTPVGFQTSDVSCTDFACNHAQSCQNLINSFVNLLLPHSIRFSSNPCIASNKDFQNKWHSRCMSKARKCTNSPWEAAFLFTSFKMVINHFKP